jgi:hypothetical protein
MLIVGLIMFDRGCEAFQPFLNCYPRALTAPHRGHNPGHNADTTSGPTAENTVLRGKARSAHGSSLQQGLMAVGASPRDPLDTLASVGSAAQGVRLERSCRAEGRARRRM